MSTADVLRQVWLFSGLTEEQLDAISSFTFQKTFEPGEMIVEEGRTGNGLYMIMSGSEFARASSASSNRLLIRRCNRSVAMIGGYYRYPGQLSIGWDFNRTKREGQCAPATMGRLSRSSRGIYRLARMERRSETSGP